MKKKLLLVTLITCVIGIGTIYACTLNQEEHCNFPNCTQTRQHEHIRENETYKCEVSGCLITSPHTHGNSVDNYGNTYNNNYYHHEYEQMNTTYNHHNNSHHRNLHH